MPNSFAIADRLGFWIMSAGIVFAVE